MATIEIDWKQTALISIFDEAHALGFNLRKFDKQNDDVKAAIKKATIASVMNSIRQEWEDGVKRTRKSQRLGDVRCGVYVISIGHGFCVKYVHNCSEVMYIGRGNIENRLRTHLHNWIFDMSRSLRDVPFRFYMEELGDGRSPDAFKDFEHRLLNDFHNKFGEKPLLNQIAGRAGTIDHSFTGNSDAPLSTRGKKFHWEIRPTEKNQWFKPVSDE